MKGKEKKKKNIGLNICIGLLMALIICIIAFIGVYSAYYKVRSEEANKTEEVENNTENENTTNYSLDFDTNNITNGTADSYAIANYSGTINITLNESGTVATLSYNRATLSNTYALNWDLTGVEDGVYENQTINFTKRVKDVFFGGIGQDSTGDIILFLMEDGTVSYIPVYQTLSTSGVDGLTTYETFNDLTDVVKFYTANATSNASSSVTVLAQTEDGTLYDLRELLNSTNNNQ